MTKAAVNNAENTTDNSANGACSRFEPIKKILIRCDEKTVAYAPSMSAMAA